ncbi:MAG: helix-hairpin-helix domain-containing protein [Bacteroidaceae bacterium]|nr:helix-hairpin-helix domain-containing protein [Bacteroidaceae bacterium]
MNKEWFFFPKGDRRAILVLSLVVIGLLSFLWWKADDGGGGENLVTSADSSAVSGFRKSILRQDDDRESSARRDTLFNSRRSHKQRRGDWTSDFSRPTGKKVFPGRVEKISADTVLDLNTVDTLLLKRVPGIGSWRARRIVEFRGHLGGYSRVSQLMEIDGMPDSIFRWFAIHTPVHKKINLNRATADEMAAHPYLTYRQARVILRHKRLHGPLQSLSQLSLYEEFTKEQLEKLEPYVAF